ncbi:MAG TPA: VWA domain-containing protein [Planctomycetota bacterium]|nr:VWA domain-containing protein [Planctomycetota bacterium]
MRLDSPLFLLALAPAAAVLALGLRAARAGGGRARLALALRAAAALALGLAAAGLLVRFGGRPRALVILDRSASMAGSREAAADAALLCERALSGRFDVEYASFAGDARVETEAGLRALEPDGSGSDVRAAMELAAERLRDGEPAVVVTDGQFREAQGSRHKEQGSEERNSQPAFVFLPIGPKGPDAALVELDAPAEIRPGEKFAVTARVAGSASGPVTVTLTSSSQAAGPGPRTRTVQLPSEGRAVRSCAFEETAPESGLLEFRAELSAPGDGFAGNNAARALVRVLGRLRVAVLGPPVAPAEALRDLDVRTLLQAEPFDPAGHDVVVVNGLPRTAPLVATADAYYHHVDDRLATQLAGFVRSGGGLAVLGGPEGCAAGGWEDSGALEKELPVSMRPPDQKLFVVLVLDRSGSMGRTEPGAKETKLSLVKRAAQELLDSFRAGDRLAVVAFSAKAEVVAGPAEPADAEARRKLANAIGNLEPGTETHLADALAEGARLLPPPSGDTKLVRHIILLSDGLPEGQGVDRSAEERRLAATAQSLADADASVSTVGTGGDDQDRELLRKVAEGWGKGRAYQPKDLSTLVSVFRRDISRGGQLEASAKFFPQPTADPLGGAFGALPEIRGRNRVSAKKLARTVFEAPAAAGLGREPWLVVWDRGRGRAACLASDFGGKWGGALTADHLKALVNWAAGRSGARGCRLALKYGAQGAQIELIAKDEKGQPIGNLAPFAELSDLAGKWTPKVDLLQESPSRYAARIAPPAEVKEIVAAVRDAKTGAELSRGAFPIPCPEELARIGVDRASVDALAELAGGRVVAAPGELGLTDFPRAAGRGVAAAAPWLALAGLLLLLAELALRAVRKSA